MKICNRSVTHIVCIALLFCGAGFLLCCSTACGYHMGSMMHPQIKTIAISTVKNETKEPLLSAEMRKQLGARFQSDNSLKLKGESEADCILYCRLLSVKNKKVTDMTIDGRTSYRPTEFSMTIEAEFTVLIPGRSEALIPLRKVSASANYQMFGDLSTARFYGMQQACYNLANLIVEYTTEAW